jgi:hypothetical protein
VAEATLRRPFGRTYEFLVEGGYSRNVRLQSSDFGASTASVYNEGFGGMVLRKHLNRTWDAIAALRSSIVAFNNTVTEAGSTGKTNIHEIGMIAIEWHPRATRIE